GAESLMRNVALGDYEKTGRFLVQPMDQPCSFRAAPFRELAATAHESVHEGSGPVPRCGVNDHSSSLVDHQEIVVLVDDPERDVLTLDVAARRCRFRLGDRDQIICRCTVGCALPGA